MADRDGGTGSVTVVVRKDGCPSLSDKLLPKTYIVVLSARADPKRLSTGTSVFM